MFQNTTRPKWPTSIVRAGYDAVGRRNGARFRIVGTKYET